MHLAQLAGNRTLKNDYIADFIRSVAFNREGESLLDVERLKSERAWKKRAEVLK